MAKMVSRMEQGEDLQSARACRKRNEVDRFMDGVPSEAREAKRRVILAANEFLAGGKGKHGLGITKLCKKYGVTHRNSLYREVEFIEMHPEMLDSIAVVAQTAPETIFSPSRDEEGSDSSVEISSSDEEDFSNMTAKKRRGKALAMATLAVHRKEKSVEEACRMAEKKFGSDHLNRETVRKYARTQPGVEGVGRGKQQIIPPEEEEKLVCLIEAMRAMKLAVYHSTVFYLANQAIAGTPYQKQFKGGVVSRFILKDISESTRSRTHAAGEAVGRDDQAPNEEEAEEDRVAGRKGMNLAKLWFRSAATGDECRSMVAEYKDGKRREQEAKEQRAADKEQKAEEMSLGAIASGVIGCIRASEEHRDRERMDSWRRRPDKGLVGAGYCFLWSHNISAIYKHNISAWTSL